MTCISYSIDAFALRVIQTIYNDPKANTIRLVIFDKKILLLYYHLQTFISKLTQGSYSISAWTIKNPKSQDDIIVE